MESLKFHFFFFKKKRSYSGKDEGEKKSYLAVTFFNLENIVLRSIFRESPRELGFN